MIIVAFLIVLYYIPYYTFRKQQRHAFLLNLERVSNTMTAWTEEQETNCDKVLLKKDIKLTYIWILGIFNLLVAEVLLHHSPYIWQ